MRSKLLFALTFCLWLFFAATAVVRADGSVLLERPFSGRPYPAPLPATTIVGIAGWYGNGPGECLGCLTDQGRLIMANGDVLDDSMLTIACGMDGSCQSLPLGTLVRITNLENGRMTIAMVTDTGGFKELNRIADCSKAVAERLGFLEEGLALVMIEVIPEAEISVPNLFH